MGSACARPRASSVADNAGQEQTAGPSPASASQIAVKDDGCDAPLANGELLAAAFLDIEHCIDASQDFATANSPFSNGSAQSLTCGTSTVHLREFMSMHKGSHQDVAERAERCFCASTEMSDVASAFGVASNVLRAVKGVVGEPIASVVGVLGALCGLAVRAIANQQAVYNLAQRVLALHPVLVKLCSSSLKQEEERCVNRILTVLNNARDLIASFVPPEDDIDESKEEKWIGSSLVSWVQSKIAMISTSADDFEAIHNSIDRVLTDFQFSAVVVMRSPTKDQLTILVQADAAALQERLEKQLSAALEIANDSVRRDIQTIQMSLEEKFSSTMATLNEREKKMDAVFHVLLRTRDFKELHVSESRVKIFEALAGGGNGEVFRAVIDGTRIAAKRSKADTQSKAQEILREAKLLTQLNHPNILHCYGVTAKGLDTYVLLERCVMTLSEAVQSYGRIPLPEAAIALVNISAGLLAVHNKELVHRDIKALNVMLKENGQVCLIDFGSAKREVAAQVYGMSGVSTSATSCTTNTGTAGTTLRYAAPELFLDRASRATAKCDVYSFGLLMFELLTAKTPFVEDEKKPDVVTLAAIAKGPTIPPELLATMEPAVVTLMRQCLDLNPDNRPTAQRVHDVLTSYLQSHCGTDSTQDSVWQGYLKRIHVIAGVDVAVSCLPQSASSPANISLPGGSPTPLKCLPSAAAVFRGVHVDGKATFNAVLSLIHALGHTDITAFQLRVALCVSGVVDGNALDEGDFLKIMMLILRVKFDACLFSMPSGLDLNETRQVLQEHFRQGGLACDKELASMFSLCDEDNDGRLSFTEFLLLVDTLYGELGLDATSIQHATHDASGLYGSDATMLRETTLKLTLPFALHVFRSRSEKGNATMAIALSVIHVLGHAAVTSLQLRLAIKSCSVNNANELNETEFIRVVEAILKTMFEACQSKTATSQGWSSRQARQFIHQQFTQCRIEDRELSSVFKLADSDRDGRLLFAEFLVLVDALHEEVSLKAASISRLIEAIATDDSNSAAYAQLGEAMTTTSVSLKDGRSLTRCQCFVEAIRCDSSNAAAYGALGRSLKDDETVTLDHTGGQCLTKQKCFSEAIERGCPSALAYYSLGRLGEATTLSDGRCLTPRECFIEALALDESFVDGFVSLGKMLKAGETMMLKNDRSFTRQQLLIEAISKDTTNALSYCALAQALEPTESVVLYDGRRVTQQRCYIEAIARDDGLTDAFINLGSALQDGEVAALNDGRRINKQQCFVEAIDLDDTCGRAYHYLSYTVGLCTPSMTVTLKDGTCITQQQCYVEAIARLMTVGAETARVYILLGLKLGDGKEVTMKDGRCLTDQQCYLEAVAADPKDSYAYYRLRTTVPPRRTVTLKDGRCLTGEALDRLIRQMP